MSRVIAAKYALGPVLGRGGMGEVYEATDTTTGREVAVKVMRHQSAAESSETSEETEREWEVRFEREVQAIETLRSHHVVEVLDAGIDPDSHDRYLVMERLRGEDLSSLGKRLGPLPQELVLRLAAQTLLGLESAHESGIVHRDIKPGNLFLTSDGARRMVRILDFGIARVRTSDDEAEDLTELTRTGSMLGSPQYMAPEQVRGARHVDHRADLWSVGVVMYRLLTGRCPHRSEDGVGGLLVAICTMPAPALQSRAPWVDPAIAGIVHRALNLKKDDRFASARAMHDAIVALLPDRKIDVDDGMLVALTNEERSNVADRLDLVVTQAMPSTRHEIDSHAGVAQTHVRPPPARSRTGIVVAIAALAVAAAGVAYAAIPRRAPPVVVPAASAAPAELSADLRVPPGIAIEVDGKPATPVNGAVPIRGHVGSMHMVKVGGGPSVPVLLVESGALPPSIELPAAPAKTSAAAPASATARAGARKPDPRPARSAAPAPTTGMRTDFE